MIKRIPACFFCLIGVACFASLPEIVQPRDTLFDIRVGFLKAGSLESSLVIAKDRYEFTGVMKTSRLVEHFFKWQGTFAAVGEFVDGKPTSGNYLVISDNKTRKNKKIVIKNQNETTVLRTGRSTKKIPAPIGLDLVSALLLLDSCQDVITVHDGEDEYRLFLEKDKSKDTRLRLGRNYYSGDAQVCSYHFQYKRNITRRFNVWLAEINGTRQPVRIQLRFPLRPNVVMSLRVDS